MTSKSSQEIQSEVEILRRKLKQFKKNELRLADLERQLEATLYDLNIHQEELRVQNEELARSREQREALLAKYSILFEHAPVGYFICDRRQRLLECNRAAALLLNVRRETLIGKPVISHLRREDLSVFAQHLKRAFAGGQSEDELELVPHGGEPIPCILQSRDIHDPESGDRVVLSVIFDISERKRQERHIAVLAERNRGILDAAEEGILGIGREGLVVFANPAATRILQYSGVRILGADPVELLRPTTADGAPVARQRLAIQRTLGDGEVRSEGDHRFQRRDGERFPVEYVVAPIYEEGEISGLVMTFRDISKRVKAQKALQRAHDDLERRVEERTRDLRLANDRLRLTAQVFESTGEAILITDAANRIVEVNLAFTRITGFSAEQAIGQDPGFMKSGRHDRSFYAGMWRDIWKNGFWQGEIWDRRKNGEIYPKWLTINTIRDESGKLVQCIGVFSDISVVKTAEEKLQRLAYFDGLTNLPNRIFFKVRLEHEFNAAHRRRTKLALLFLDLDNFKTINDTLGHAAGDDLLVEVAKRLCGCVRQSDTVSRLGGDEFTLIITDVEEESAIALVARNILQSVQRPIVLEGRRVTVGCSIGIAFHPEDGQSVDALIKNADAAMYHAKESGRNAYVFFSSELNMLARRRLDFDAGPRLANELPEAGTTPEGNKAGSS